MITRRKVTLECQDLNGDLVYRAHWTNEKKNTKPDKQVFHDVISQNLEIGAGESFEVWCEFESGQIVKLWPVDGEFVSRTDVQKTPNKKSKNHASEKPVLPQKQSNNPAARAAHSEDFINPYNFIPAPRPETKAKGLEWGMPMGHMAWKDELLSGRLNISITARTPLLLLDTKTARKQAVGEKDKFHWTYDIRQVDKKPILSVTSLKGSLRAAFEAVTNSRYGVFNQEQSLGKKQNVKCSQLETYLLPSKNITELSPADQVFGWVKQRKPGDKSRPREAYKGQLRIAEISPGQHPDGDAIEDFREGPLPLAILSSPKPEQALFYATENDDGTAMKAGSGKGQYKPGMKLRGRKVYPHQNGLPDNYWQHPKEGWSSEQADAPLNGRVREYLRAENKEGKRKDSQNRSVTGWVKPGTTFEAEVAFSNLTKEQLGALLYVCSLKEGYHKLGAAKPLGFGSVSINVENVKASSGREIRKAYSQFSLLDDPFAGECDQKVFKEAFKESIAAAYGKPFDEVSFISAFCTAAKGFSDQLPVHYPRPGRNPDPRAASPENFKWFMENKKEKQKGWLPPVEEPGLPYLEQQQGRGR